MRLAKAVHTVYSPVLLKQRETGTLPARIQQIRLITEQSKAQDAGKESGAVRGAALDAVADWVWRRMYLRGLHPAQKRAQPRWTEIHRGCTRKER